MSEKQNIKTVIHEIAHANMHNRKDVKIDRRTTEVETEAAAYVACKHFGLDTSYLQIFFAHSGRILK